MKRNYLLFICIILAVTSCSKKTVPAKTNNVTIVTPATGNNKNHTGTTTPSTTVATDTAPATAPVTTEKIWIILDKGGRLTGSKSSFPVYVTTGNSLPDNQPFTPQQRNNLLSRHKTLLPLALYVPQAYAAKSPKGDYYKYKGKYWYWKKSDGFFYLDDIYYK